MMNLGVFEPELMRNHLAASNFTWVTSHTYFLLFVSLLLPFVLPLRKPNSWPCARKFKCLMKPSSEGLILECFVVCVFVGLHRYINNVPSPGCYPTAPMCDTCTQELGKQQAVESFSGP